MTTWQTFLFAISLGLGAGITPGPLSSLVIQESLRSGWKSGACVALAPPVADVLIVGLVLTLRTLVPMEREAGGVGSVLLSFRKGLLVNLLNPHPYIFWLTVGGPLVTDNARHDMWLPIMAFLLGFYGCLVGSKVLIAVLVHGGRARLHGRGYRIALRLSGVSLLLFGLLLIWDGVSTLVS